MQKTAYLPDLQKTVVLLHKLYKWPRISAILLDKSQHNSTFIFLSGVPNCGCFMFSWFLSLWLFSFCFHLTYDCDCFNIRRVWRYQRGNHNPYIEEEQTTQWPKLKVQKCVLRLWFIASCRGAVPATTFIVFSINQTRHRPTIIYTQNAS
jgi:hypothetical protein